MKKGKIVPDPQKKRAHWPASAGGKGVGTGLRERVGCLLFFARLCAVGGSGPSGEQEPILEPLACGLFWVMIGANRAKEN